MLWLTHCFHNHSRFGVALSQTQNRPTIFSQFSSPELKSTTTSGSIWNKYLLSISTLAPHQCPGKCQDPMHPSKHLKKKSSCPAVSTARGTGSTRSNYHFLYGNHVGSFAHTGACQHTVGLFLFETQELAFKLQVFFWVLKITSKKNRDTWCIPGVQNTAHTLICALWICCSHRINVNHFHIERYCMLYMPCTRAQTFG